MITKRSGGTSIRMAKTRATSCAMSSKLRCAGSIGCGQRIAKHRIAEGAGGADGRCAGRDQFLGAHMADALAGFFAEKDQPAAGAATEAALARARRIDHLAGGRGNGARLVVDVAIAAQVAGIVKDDFFLVSGLGLAASWSA